MKWAIGAVAAVLGAMAVLPGVASAGHFEYEQEIICDNGTFSASLTYDAGGTELNVIITVDVNGERYSGNATTGGVQTTKHPNVVDAPASWGTTNNFPTNPPGNSFTFSDTRDRFEVDGHGGAPDLTDRFDDFMTISGSYGDVDAQPDDSVDIEGNIYIHNPGFFNDSLLDDTPNTTLDSSPGEAGDSFQRSITLADFQKCATKVCIDGQINAEALSFQDAATNDCDPVRVCVDGENFFVTEFQQQQGNLDLGDCIVIDIPPPPSTPPTTVTTPPAPVQQVAGAVAEVLPARLPSTGTGPGETSSGVSLVAVLAIAMLSIGGVATLVARRSAS
jgi:hypothetical protein